MIGTPYTPTLANLHIVYNEERNSFRTALTDTAILFFRRYINNIFFIIKGLKKDIKVLLI